MARLARSTSAQANPMESRRLVGWSSSVGDATNGLYRRPVELGQLVGSIAIPA